LAIALQLWRGQSKMAAEARQGRGATGLSVFQYRLLRRSKDWRGRLETRDGARVAEGWSQGKSRGSISLR